MTDHDTYTVALNVFELQGLIDWLIQGLRIGQSIGAPSRDLKALSARIDGLEAMLK